MRKFGILFTLVTVHTTSFSQFNSGFDKLEALDMIRICNSQTFIDVYGTDAGIIPSGYKKMYSSTPNVLDNMFQVYQKNDVGVIHFRGSTAKVNSWVENFYSAMIPAQGEITVYDELRPYCYARQDEAAVHSGYALAIALLTSDLMSQVKLLNAHGIFDILIIGHSQGGALATMAHAYLEHMDKKELSSRNRFKVYAFANPMAGNAQFAQDYDERFTSQQKSFRIANTSDIVPNMPFTYSDKPLLTTENVVSWLKKEERPDFKKMGIDLVMKKFDGGLTAYINKSNELIRKVIAAQAGSVIVPDYVDDIKYVHVGSFYELKPFSYPEIIKDSIDIPASDFKNFQRLSNGKYQRKEPSFFQHKPYNYYVEFAKQYLKEEYSKISMKYLDDNL